MDSAAGDLHLQIRGRAGPLELWLIGVFVCVCVEKGYEDINDMTLGMIPKAIFGTK